MSEAPPTAEILQFPPRADPPEYGGIADINAEPVQPEFLNCLTRLDIPPDRVLEGAVGELKEVLVLGIDHDGKMWVATSIGDDEARLAHLPNRFLHKLYNGDYCA